MKPCIQKKKLVFILLLAVFALGCLGQSSAYWREGLRIEGTGYKKAEPCRAISEPVLTESVGENGSSDMPPVLTEVSPVQEAGPVLETQTENPGSVPEEEIRQEEPTNSTPSEDSSAVLQTGTESAENHG